MSRRVVSHPQRIPSRSTGSGGNVMPAVYGSAPSLDEMYASGSLSGSRAATMCFAVPGSSRSSSGSESMPFQAPPSSFASVLPPQSMTAPRPAYQAPALPVSRADLVSSGGSGLSGVRQSGVSIPTVPVIPRETMLAASQHVPHKLSGGSEEVLIEIDSGVSQGVASGPTVHVDENISSRPVFDTVSQVLLTTAQSAGDLDVLQDLIRADRFQAVTVDLQEARTMAAADTTLVMEKTEALEAMKVENQCLKQALEYVKQENFTLRRDKYALQCLVHVLYQGVDAIFESTEKLETVLNHMQPLVKSLSENSQASQVLSGGYFQKHTTADVADAIRNGLRGKKLCHEELNAALTKLKMEIENASEFESGGGLAKSASSGSSSSFEGYSGESISSSMASRVSAKVEPVPVAPEEVSAEPTLEGLGGSTCLSKDNILLFLQGSKEAGHVIGTFNEFLLVDPGLHELIPEIISDIMLEYYNITGTTAGECNVFTVAHTFSSIIVEPKQFDGLKFQTEKKKGDLAMWSSDVLPVGLPHEQMELFRGTDCDPAIADNKGKFFSISVTNYLKWTTETSRKAFHIIQELRRA